MLRNLPRQLVIIALISSLLALFLAFDVIPFLRGGFGWQWPYVPAMLGRIVSLVSATSIYVVGGWLLLKQGARSRLLLLWGLLGAAILPLAVIAVRSDNVAYELFVRTASGVTTGPHLAAAEMDWSSGAWRDWPSVMNSYEGRSVHVRLGPPGLPMFYGLVNAFFDANPSLADPLYRALVPWQCNNWNLLAYSPGEWASAWFGMLMPFWAALAVFPLFEVGKRLIGDRARLAVLWWPLVPSLVMFVPTWNTLYPLLSLLAFWLLLAGLDRPRGAWHFLAAGLVTGLLTFANFSLIPLVGFLGIYILLYERYDRATGELFQWQRLTYIALWLTLGISIPWFLYWLVSGLTPLDLLRVAMDSHLDLDRPYLPWLWLHLWEWALMTGIPLIVLWLLSIRQRHDRGFILSMALLLTMILLLLSGTARGETGRVWLFFAPFVLIAAAGSLGSAGESPGAAGRSWLVVSVGQAALMIALAATWDVINAPDMSPPPESPPVWAASRQANASFNNSFRLTGWDAEVNGNTIQLHLDWQGMAQMTIPYWFSALLVRPDGAPVADSVVWQPDETRYPTTCWKPGETVGDTIVLPLPPSATAGDWWVSLAAFADVNKPEERLSVTAADGTSDTQVGLGPIRVRQAG